MEPPKYPVVFTKAISALTGHNCPILLPKVARDEVDYEAEVSVDSADSMDSLYFLHLC